VARKPSPQRTHRRLEDFILCERAKEVAGASEKAPGTQTHAHTLAAGGAAKSNARSATVATSHGVPVFFHTPPACARGVRNKCANPNRVDAERAFDEDAHPAYSDAERRSGSPPCDTLAERASL